MFSQHTQCCQLGCLSTCMGSCFLSMKDQEIHVYARESFGDVKHVKNGHRGQFLGGADHNEAFSASLGPYRT